MTLGTFAQTIFKRTYAHEGETCIEDAFKRVAKVVANGDHDYQGRLERVLLERKFCPAGRYLANAGRRIQQLNNCFTSIVEDSRDSWAENLDIGVRVLSTGGGFGLEVSKLRARGTPIAGVGGVASGPVPFLQMINEVARHVRAGGSRRSALIGLLHWNHPDIEEFISIKNWSTDVRAMKERDFDFPAPLDMMNISVRLDNEFLSKVTTDPGTKDLYYRLCKSMCKTGEPGFSINVNGESDQWARNPCAEVVSSEQYDLCNLGSINLANIESLDELEEVTRIAVEFLYRGTFLSWMPHPVFEETRNRTRRIGLGIMGLHEWCIKHDFRYEPSGLLGRWLGTWEGVSDEEAKKVAARFDGVAPVAVRAVAPTGTISILSGTTSGIEPIYCVAYKRRYLDSDGKWKFQYVVDPTAERLVKEGVDPDSIEDSVALSKNVERRLQMQAFIEDFVDQAVSSTINLPEYGEYGNNNVRKFSEILLSYLPRLRGVTTYPDGARPGQPIVPLKYDTVVRYHKEEAVRHEEEETCRGGVCEI